MFECNVYENMLASQQNTTGFTNPYVSPLDEQEEQMLQWSIFATPTGHLCSHLPYTVNHHKSGLLQSTLKQLSHNPVTWSKSHGHSSSSSVFPATALRLTFFFLSSLVRFYLCDHFFYPTIEVVTFCLCGWFMLVIKTWVELKEHSYV